jgi:methionyl-tRNA formyltransferase
LVQSPIADLATEAGLPVLKPQRPRDADFVEELTAWAPDVCPVVAYGSLIPRQVLDIPRLGWVNLHFSLLPAWRGAAPVQHAINAGDEVTGASTFLLEEGMDTGPVFGTVTTAIAPDDTSGDLLARLADSGAELLVRTLDAMEDGTIVPVPQPDDGVSLAPKVTVDDARLRWDLPALALDRLARSCTPAPGAWTTFRGERIKLGPVALEPSVTDLGPGVLRVDRTGVVVGTGSHAVRLVEVQPTGKRSMLWRDWANGARPLSDERFE